MNDVYLNCGSQDNLRVKKDVFICLFVCLFAMDVQSVAKTRKGHVYVT
jgi:hypothetical protein